MKKIFAIITAVLLLAGCSQDKQNIANITGKWYVYKWVVNNSDHYSVAPYSDSIKNYNITFSADGHYIEQNAIPNLLGVADTTYAIGTWAFQNANEYLVLTDTGMHVRTYTIFNLMGNSVELRRASEDRYMRKVQ